MSNLITPQGYNTDVQQRMFKDCLDSLDADYKPSAAPQDLALELGREIRSRVIKTIRPLLADPTLMWDSSAKKNLAQVVANAYANEFARLKQEDVVWIITYIHANGLMAKIVEQCG